jgi:hypothetical protein
MDIIIIIKSPPSSAGFEPRTLGSNIKHNNHKTTEREWQQSLTWTWQSSGMAVSDRNWQDASEMSPFTKAMS